MKTWLTGFAAALLAGGIAMGQTAEIRTFTGVVDDNWHNQANWQLGDPGSGPPDGQIPDKFDKVIIPAGKFCHIKQDLADADTIHVRATTGNDGVLRIRANTGVYAYLTLWNHAELAAPNSVIHGTVELADYRSKLSFVNNSHIIGGRGKIVGWKTENNDTIFPVFEIGANLKVTSRLAAEGGGIVGCFQFEGGNSTFRNEGKLEASRLSGTYNNYRGKITLPSTIAIEDIVGARWNAVDCGTLCFLTGATELDGDFKIDKTVGVDARMYIVHSIATTGTLTYNSGRLWVRCNESFCFGNLAGQAACIAQLSPCGISADCCIVAPQAVCLEYNCNTTESCTMPQGKPPENCEACGACITGPG